MPLHCAPTPAQHAGVPAAPQAPRHHELLIVVLQGGAMSGKGEDKNSVAETVEAACEKVGEAGAAAAQKAKETAAHLQPGGSQVGKVGYLRCCSAPGLEGVPVQTIT